MAFPTRKQVLALVLVSGFAFLHSVSARTQCQALGASCSDEWQCCGEMKCSRTGYTVYFSRIYNRGDCMPTTPHECAADSEQFHATLHEDSPYRGVSTRTSTCTLGECQDIDWSGISSLTWSENAALAVYDEESCGGNSLLVYSAGPYKRVLEDGNTRTQGFLAGGVRDLSKVCKHDRCGYDSHAGAPFGGVLQANNNGSCKCAETWNDGIQSYRIFRRTALDAARSAA